MKILLVDDDADDRSIFCEAVRLIDSNIECEVTVDGKDALKKLNAQDRKYDMIFLDLNMPAMSGKELFRHIKSHENFRDIPVVICSTSTDRQEIDWFRQMSTPYLVKPTSFDHLINSLHQYIQPSGGRATATV
jgi:CheY-like chemotaxis protein